MDLTALLLPCFYSFIACCAYCILFNIRGFGMVLCSLGGALAWLTYLLAAPLVGHNTILQSFWAAVFLSVYSEIMSRIRKCPVTGYQLLAFIPLVPGGGIYKTMEYCINGETDLFVSTGVHTLGISGALAVGVLLVSSGVRMYYAFRRRVKKV